MSGFLNVMNVIMNGFNQSFTVYGFTLSFWDIWLWSIIGAIVAAFIGGYAQVMDNFSKTCAAIILLLSLAAGAVALDAKAEDYTPDEAAQEEQEQAPSIDTSSYVQVADPALYAKLDTLQESIDRLADALTPADAETDAEAPTEEQPAPDYTAQLSGISAQLADMAQQATAETAEDADPFQKPFEEYTTGETLALIGVVLLLVFGVFSLFKNFVL